MFANEKTREIASTVDVGAANTALVLHVLDAIESLNAIHLRVRETLTNGTVEFTRARNDLIEQTELACERVTKDAAVAADRMVTDTLSKIARASKSIVDENNAATMRLLETTLPAIVAGAVSSQMSQVIAISYSLKKLQGIKRFVVITSCANAAALAIFLLVLQK